MRIIAFVLALLPMTLLAVELTGAQRSAIEDRIKPYSQVCLPGEECGGAAASVASGTRSGKDIYAAACVACHSSGAAGAPIVGDAAAWSPRLAKGMDALYDSGVNGVPGTGMIAKGGCAQCSDDEINAAVDYMADNSR